MRFHIAAATLCLLAGCGSQSANQQAANQQDANQQEGGSRQADGSQQADANRPAAPTQTAAAPAAGGGGLTIQPGEWEITMEMQAAQASGLPAGTRIPQIPPRTVRSCVTPEQVARANASFLNGGRRAGMDCDYSHVSVGGGHIQGTSTCSRTGMQATVVMDGTFTPTSYDIHQQMRSTMRGQTISSTNHLVGRRVGECTPGQASAASSGAGNEQGGR